MNCSSVRDRLVAYTENGVPITDELGMDVHLIQCSSCKEELAEIHELSATLRVEAMSVEVAPRFSALREKMEGEASVTVPARRSSSFRLGLAPIAAVLTITCLAVIASFSRAPSQGESSSVFGAAFDAHIRESLYPNLPHFDNRQDAFYLDRFDILDTSPHRKSSLSKAQ